jgi:hypothetical protein
LICFFEYFSELVSQIDKRLFQGIEPKVFVNDARHITFLRNSVSTLTHGQAADLDPVPLRFFRGVCLELLHDALLLLAIDGVIIV